MTFSNKNYKKKYGELEAFQKTQKIIKMLDLTLNNCFFTLTLLKGDPQKFFIKIETIKGIFKIYLVSFILGF